MPMIGKHYPYIIFKLSFIKLHYINKRVYYLLYFIMYLNKNSYNIVKE